MALVFSYGTLQQRDVQLKAFGRQLEGGADQLPEFELRQNGPHANVVLNGRRDHRVPGTALEITDRELAAADRYEAADGYTRVGVALASGRRAWMYLDPPSCQWTSDGAEEELTFLPVMGRDEVRSFHMSSTTVTQAIWTHVMGTNSAPERHPRRPITHVSWHDVTGRDGFLDRLNGSRAFPDRMFRLPTEAEWEYAARGGPHASDGFRFSGSNDIAEVAWYSRRFAAWRRLVCGVLGWRLGWGLVSRPPNRGTTHEHDVALKKPNQLGLYDMTGNVWEWCQDECGDGERRLRGGCHHNWDIHCTNAFRYSQAADQRGNAIGFRLVLA